MAIERFAPPEKKDPPIEYVKDCPIENCRRWRHGSPHDQGRIPQEDDLWLTCQVWQQESMERP